MGLIIRNTAFLPAWTAVPVVGKFPIVEMGFLITCALLSWSASHGLSTAVALTPCLFCASVLLESVSRANSFNPGDKMHYTHFTHMGKLEY